jgi:hypothetical protein
VNSTTDVLHAPRHVGARVTVIGVNPPEPPGDVHLSLDESLALLADLEDARDALIDAHRLALVVGVEAQMSAEPLRASEAARRLGITTRELMELIHDRKIAM